MAHKSSDEIAALFFEKFQDGPYYESDGALIRKKSLTKKQAKWLSDVWLRENRGIVTAKNFGGKGRFTMGGAYCTWTLWLYPKGGGVLEVRELLGEA